VLGVLALRPLLTGVRWSENGPAWRIQTSRGSLWAGPEALPEQANLKVGNWRVEIARPEKHHESIETTKLVKEEVPAEELVSSVAEAIRLVGTLVTPPEPKTSEIRRSGSGWLEVRDGHIQMFLEGTPYEIGLQHGKLDPAGVRKVCRRLVYGVGLLYSFKKGEWFPIAARKLIERQRPFIAPAYFEEMQGLADGSALPLDLIQMANIFPEFFHCSGVALMGEATKGGELLHARVLDYMVGIGLQDHAAVMAISRPGVNRFVTVGYLGFIGSVTGMNEKQVAIGEMGGDGQGDWDGIPMSLLIRQALEDCNTLQEVETFMRESPRTCEYYYVISDGKGPSAVGVAATPKKFETFGPGVWHERLTEPVKDAVLLSGPGRYEALVERVRRDYGKITPDDLIEIIKRPVAMKSNLHNVIFRPQTLRLSVADASRRGVACDEPYRSYTWNDLFSAAPSR
jgi:isopenicillin-N N-acyltransferase-like protein